MRKKVLILVLVEYAPRVIYRDTARGICYSLNPCFSGICAARRMRIILTEKQNFVLILVLVEYAPRGPVRDPQKECGAGVLILVLVEYAPRDLRKFGKSQDEQLS